MPTTRVLRFGPFELDVRSGELRRRGIRVRLPEQSFQVLLLLLEHPGEVVLREDIRLRLWPNDTIVEYDHSINAVMKRLRQALGESAEAPRYIERVAKRGYRFLGEVERVDEPETESDGGVVSHYRLLEKVGQGGMGVVYRAQDLNLGRHVAVKFLSSSHGRLSDSALRRFQVEARAASALNHPNICIIHGLETLGGKPAIVMELIEGETLADQLSVRPLTVIETLKVAIQIAGALAEAHRCGVVHGDLKPANIMLTRNGVKVLDFGLAKFPAEYAASVGDTGSQSGVVGGTLYYLSPEQVQGRQPDQCSDIFSFGLVIYEMLTGRRAFDGASAAFILSAIAEASPARLIGVPPALQVVVDRCLAKNPADRWESAVILEAELKRIAAESSQPVFVTPEPRDAEPPPGGRTFPRLAVAAAILVGAVLVYLMWSRFSAAPSAPLNITRVTETGDVNRSDISPDCRYLAYAREIAGKQSVWMKQLAAETDVKLADLGRDSCAGIAFSPDGSYVYFVRLPALQRSGDLYQVPVLGGTPRKVLAEVGGSPSFSPDGQHIAFVRDTAAADIIVTAAVDRSQESVLATYRRPAGVAWDRVAWSSDGTTLAFGVYGVEGTTESSRMVYTMPAGGGPARRVSGAQLAGIADLTWLPGTSNLLIVGVPQGATAAETTQIYEVPSKGGELRPITHDLSTYIEVRAGADGRTLMAVGGQESVVIEVATSGASPARVLSTEMQNGDGRHGLAWTPEGTIVYSSAHRGVIDLWETGEDGSGPRRLTASGTSSAAWLPAVSSRGDFIVFARHEAGRENIWRMNRDGSHLRQLTTGAADTAPAISPDERWVIFTRGKEGKSVLMRVPSEGGTASQLTEYSASSPSVSPDGKWIACEYFVPGQPASLAVIPFDGGQPAKVFPQKAEILTPIRWKPDGSGISFLVDGELWEEPVAGGPIKPLDLRQMLAYAWSADGRLAASCDRRPADAVLIKNFR